MNEAHDSQFVINREARTFPAGWQHPRDARGTYVPMFEAGYAVDPDQGVTNDDLMPEGDDEIAAYETTTEGTPISPPFPNTPEGRLALVAWCAANATAFGKHRANGEAWAAALWGGDAAITPDGIVLA